MIGFFFGGFAQHLVWSSVRFALVELLLPSRFFVVFLLYIIGSLFMAFFRRGFFFLLCLGSLLPVRQRTVLCPLLGRKLAGLWV